MTLALTAKLTTQDAAQATLVVSGAQGGLPIGSPVYTADWSAGLDSWAGADDDPVTNLTPGMLSGQATGGTYAMYAGAAYAGHFSWRYPSQRVYRTITGLTSGRFYRIRSELNLGSGSQPVSLTVGVPALSVLSDPVPVPSSSWAPIEAVFTATGTSHVVEFRRIGTGEAVVFFRNFTVQRLSSIDTGITVQRTDRNGARNVRQPEGLAPDSLGAATLIDEEFALPLPGSDVTYVVRDAAGFTASATLRNANNSTAFVWDDQSVLTPVGFPDRALFVPRVSDFNESLRYGEGTTSTLVVLGRADPISVSRTDDVWTLRTGTVTYYAASYADAEAIRSAYEFGRVALLRFSQLYPADLYHVAQSIDITPLRLRADGWAWQVAVAYTEVAWPAGDLQGSGTSWTYDDVADSYLAYFNLPTAFATYADLKAGP